MNTEQEREAFEDWILPGKDKNLPGHQNTLARYPSGNYMTYSIAKQWDAWQARAAIEADRKRRGEPVKVPSMRDLISDDAYAAMFQSVGQYRKALLARYGNSDIGQSAEQPDYTSAAKACRSVGANSFAECFERAAQHKAAKCDGDHGGPRCADPECWNDSSD